MWNDRTPFLTINVKELRKMEPWKGTSQFQELVQKVRSKFDLFRVRGKIVVFDEYSSKEEDSTLDIAQKVVQAASSSTVVVMAGSFVPREEIVPLTEDDVEWIKEEHAWEGIRAFQFAAKAFVDSYKFWTAR